MPGRQVVNAPDPTLLTIDSIRREIAMVNEATAARFEAAEALTAERFHRVDENMGRAEALRKEQKADTKSAVDAALESQKEATAKMERSIAEQLSSIKANFETEIRSIRSSESDLKDRMTIVESIRQGQAEQRTETRQISAGWVGLIGAVGGIILVVIAVYPFLTRMP